MCQCIMLRVCLEHLGTPGAMLLYIPIHVQNNLSPTMACKFQHFFGLPCGVCRPEGEWLVIAAATARAWGEP